MAVAVRPDGWPDGLGKNSAGCRGAFLVENCRNRDNGHLGRYSDCGHEKQRGEGETDDNKEQQVWRVTTVLII